MATTTSAAKPVASTGTISGTVFADTNDDGAREAAEVGVAGRIVTLVNTVTGVEVGAAVSDANGNYSFAGLPAGSYVVQFDHPCGTAFSPVGTSGKLPDSTVSYAGAATVNLSAGGNATINAGIYTLPTVTGIPIAELPGNRNTLKLFSEVAIAGFPQDNATTTATIAVDPGGVSSSDGAGTLSGASLTETAPGSGIYTLSAATPTLLQAAMRKLVFTPAAGNTPAQVTFVVTVTQGSQTANAYTVLSEPCFLAGTRILTPRGEVAVEELDVGEPVMTLMDGKIVPRPIRWIGSRHVDALALRRSGLHPVRIRAGAFAEAVPHRDLLVTPDHCVFIDGCLVPARMLVNGGSILVDHEIESFSYFHVELDLHGVLLAEGLTTESYLDTGNRGTFSNEAVCALHFELALDATHKSWARDACAPLATTRERVEPIWRRLYERASQLGLITPQPEASLSADPQLRVLLDDGETLGAKWNGPGRYFLRIPPGRKPLRLLSRTAAPAEVIGPFVDDRRQLGVLVERMVFWSGLRDNLINPAGPALPGWHPAEAAGSWTDGDAVLDLPRAGCADTFLEIRLVGDMLYEADEQAALAA